MIRISGGRLIKLAGILLVDIVVMLEGERNYKLEEGEVEKMMVSKRRVPGAIYALMERANNNLGSKQ